MIGDSLLHYSLISSMSFLDALSGNVHKNETKSSFFDKTRKFKFAGLLHIPSPRQKCKQAVIFCLKLFCLSEKNGIFDLTFRLDLARFSESGPNWAENRPFSFNSHFATVERRKVPPAYCRTNSISRLLD